MLNKQSSNRYKVVATEDSDDEATETITELQTPRGECCLCAAMHGTIVAIHGVTEPTAFPLPLNLLISLENAFSHFCKEAASAPKWQKLLHF